MNIPKEHEQEFARFPAVLRASSSPQRLPPATVSPLVERSRESMAMNHLRWHDGTGYDLALLRSATPEERRQIEQLLLAGGVREWRDAEALAALDTPRARGALRRAFAGADNRLKVALLSHAPALFSDTERTAALVSALEAAEIYGGLTQALLLVES